MKSGFENHVRGRKVFLGVPVPENTFGLRKCFVKNTSLPKVGWNIGKDYFSACMWRGCGGAVPAKMTACVNDIGGMAPYNSIFNMVHPE